VSPGVVRTEALEHFQTFRDEGPDVVSEVEARTPAGRLCTPADVADVVAYLCSDEATMICGQTIIVDGGYSLLAR
jgi:enoyl-[acyl-carrier protein] reductase III